MPDTQRKVRLTCLIIDSSHFRTQGDLLASSTALHEVVPIARCSVCEVQGPSLEVGCCVVQRLGSVVEPCQPHWCGIVWVLSSVLWSLVPSSNAFAFTSHSCRTGKKCLTGSRVKSTTGIQ